MFKSGREGGTLHLSDTSPLEMAARFLAGQAWSTRHAAPTGMPRDTDQRAASARQMMEYIDRHWHGHVGQAQLLIRTCFKRPNRAILSRICGTTGAPENVVIAILDAAVEHTASDSDFTAPVGDTVPADDDWGEGP